MNEGRAAPGEATPQDRALPAPAPFSAALVVAAALPLSFALGALGSATLAGATRLAFASTAPGWLVLLLAWRWCRADREASWLRALTLSPLVYALATLALRLGAGLDVEGSARAAAWAICAGLALASATALRATRARARPAAARSPLDTLLALLPPACFAALVAWVLAAPGTRLSYHGLLHGGIVAQLVAGVVPPENPALAGEPIGFYWIYHWLLAVQGQLCDLSILETAPVLNGLNLVVYVGASQRILRRFLPPRRAALAAFAAGFAGNLCFPLLFAAGVLAGGAPAAGAHLPFELLALGIPAGDPRLATLLSKFLSMNGFPMGLACFALLLDELAPAPGRRPQGAIVFLALCGAALFHTTTLLGAGPALGAAWLAARTTRDARASARAVLPMAAIFVAALVATSPYLASVTAAAHAPRAFPPGWEVFAYDAKGLLLGATPLLAVVVLAARSAWASPLPRFLLVATASLLALGVLLSLPDGNQYKFPLLAALPGGALLFWCVREGATPVARSVFAAAVGLALASHAITAAAWLRSNMPGWRHVAGDGGYLAFPGNPPLDAALRWLRERTPPDAVVLGEPGLFGDSPISAGSGRNDFVLQGGHQTLGNPSYPRRFRLATRLLAPEGFAGPVARPLRAELDRPLYVLLVRSDDPATFDAVAEKLARAPESFEPVYRTREVAIYLVRSRESEAGESRSRSPASRSQLATAAPAARFPAAER